MCHFPLRPAPIRRLKQQLLKYEGYDFAHPRLAPPLRPMVAHEVNLEAMRQAEVRDHGDDVFARVAAVVCRWRCSVVNMGGLHV